MRLLFFITQLTDLSTSLKLLLTRYFYFLLSYPQPVENFYTHWENYSHIVEKTLFYSLRTSCGKLPPFMIK